MHPSMEQVLAHRIIVIVRGLAPGDMEGLAGALAEGGIRMIEVTFNQAKPETWGETAEAIALLAERFDGRVLPGAGTVMTPEQVRIARDAGAQYIISPHTDEAVIREAKALGLAAFPGAMTPTEIVRAHAAGADAVKVFPAGSLGPGYIKALVAPLPHIPLMAVGGVTEQNAADFLRAGALGLGVGGGLVDMALIRDRRWAEITALAARMCEAVRGV